jgi:multiple sugar transport system ATP-binding protein
MNLVARDDHLVGFRPENFLPAAVVPGDGSKLHLHLAVRRIEYLSGDRHVYGTVTELGEENRVIARLPATVMVPVEADAVYEFAVHERDLLFFDRETGLRTAPRSLRV